MESLDVEKSGMASLMSQFTISYDGGAAFQYACTEYIPIEEQNMSDFYFTLSHR
jgi:hypothetical protein